MSKLKQEVMRVGRRFRSGYRFDLQIRCLKIQRTETEQGLFSDQFPSPPPVVHPIGQGLARLLENQRIDRIDCAEKTQQHGTKTRENSRLLLDPSPKIASQNRIEQHRKNRGNSGGKPCCPAFGQQQSERCGDDQN